MGPWATLGALNEASNPHVAISHEASFGSGAGVRAFEMEGVVILFSWRVSGGSCAGTRRSLWVPLVLGRREAHAIGAPSRL